MAAQPAIAAVGRDQFDILLSRFPEDRCIGGSVGQSHDLERRKMLPGMDRLFERDRRFTFHDEKIEIFPHQDVNGFGKGAHDTGFDLAQGVDHGQGPVFENRIGIENEQSCVHRQRGCRTIEQEACRREGGVG